MSARFRFPSARLISGLVNAALVWAAGRWTSSPRVAALPLWTWLLTVAAMSLGGPGDDVILGGNGLMAYGALLLILLGVVPPVWVLWRTSRPALTGRWDVADRRRGCAAPVDCCAARARQRRATISLLGRADEIRSWGSYTNVPLTPGEEPTALPSPLFQPRSPPQGQLRSALRRVLRRARDGVALNIDEAAVAMTARGDDLADLCASAARVRDAGLESAGRRGPSGRLPITYSRKVFIPVTHLCRDTCHYCTFVTVPGKLRAQGAGMYLEPDEILDIARRGAELGCKEALFTLGDRPEERWPEAREWLAERGYDSTLSYVRAMAIRVLEETGLLPHLNPGVMSWSEMSRLKPVAPSMGMMLETTSRRLFETKGLAHYGSPDKDPAVRLRVLTDAGRLSIPFTTGLLVGIGETLAERADTLHAIRKSHKEFGHIQEVIVQNFRAKEHTAMAAVPDAGIEDYLATVAVARLVLGPGMRIQAPPNLVSRDECLALVGAGVDDWGGVSPLTPDHVNPERPWPALDELAAVTAEAGYDLVQRLTAQPKYVQAGAAWIDPRVRGHVVALADPATGLARDVNPVGMPWQEPDDVESSGRVDLNAAIDTEGRNTEARSDLDSAFGDWESIRSHVHELAARAPERIDTDVLAALRSAERDPGRLHRRRIPGAGDRRRSRAGSGCRAGRFVAPRRGRRRRDLRGEPQHQLHQHLLHRLPVLRIRSAQG